MKSVLFAILATFLFTTIAQEAEAGWGSRRSSWSRSRSTYRSAPRKTTPAPSKPAQATKPTQQQSATADTTTKTTTPPKKTTTTNTVVKNTGSSLVPLALLYLATRPSHNGSSSQPVPAGCTCNDKGEPSSACPSDVKCEANPQGK